MNTATLLTWFSREKRAMPWRGEGATPYRVWVSEIMLQQTQVDKVVDYFERFMTRFPDVAALAAAGEGEVLAVWAGLGYYSRARNLHRAARQVAQAGRLPDTAEGWRALPGVGRYTVGAIRSIAYGEPLPLVDGNVVRVMARVLGLKIRRGDPAGEKQVWRACEEIVQHDDAARARPGDFNQALMELGATLCRPKAPRCLLCPLRGDCVAAASPAPDQYPLPKRAALRQAVTLQAAWVERGGRVLVVRRPKTGLWAGMAALPSVVGERPGALGPELERCGFSKVRVGAALASVERTLTHRHVRLSLTAVSSARAAPRLPAGARWVLREDLAGAGMPAAFLALTQAHLAAPRGP